MADFARDAAAIGRLALLSIKTFEFGRFFQASGRFLARLSVEVSFATRSGCANWIDSRALHALLSGKLLIREALIVWVFKADTWNLVSPFRTSGGIVPGSLLNKFWLVWFSSLAGFLARVDAAPRRAIPQDPASRCLTVSRVLLPDTRRRDSLGVRGDNARDTLFKTQYGLIINPDRFKTESLKINNYEVYVAAASTQSSSCHANGLKIDIYDSGAKNQGPSA